MARFVGVRHNRICVVSDKSFSNEGLEIIEIPPELSHVSPTELITSCVVCNGKIKYKHIKKSAKDLKVALVGNWKMQCGIATYSQNLWPEVVKHVGDFKLFIEDNSVIGNLNEIGGQIIPDDKVKVCWKRGQPTSDLAKAIKEYDPDIVWIQHEFGLFPDARHWLSLMSQLSDYRVIVTMHSVFHHKDKTICEAAIPEIVVHLQGGYEVLKNEKKVPGKVYVIPHGCFPCTSKERLWNMYKSERTFMQFGFGFRYKGWENSIRATAELKKKFPDVFFTGLFSESAQSKTEHDVYYHELTDLIEQLDIQENVALIRGFQSDETLDSYMRTNQATLFPYVSHPAHEVYGASGAARIAMSKALPVVTSSVNHFSDLPTIKADTSEDIAKALEQLFTNPAAREAQVKKQIDYLNENTWENIASRYILLFEMGC
jgi:glycosyltransferase involved in cell wall biosynthesis